jgi:hypothetical protein
MVEVDVISIALLGFATGLGTTFGGEIARFIFSKIAKLAKKQ